MGIYQQYLEQPIASNFAALTAERKKQLLRISEARGDADVLVFAADMGKEVPGLPISIGYPDLLPFQDQLGSLKGNRLELILETPGGLGEVVEEIVKLIRSRYSEFSVIVPGWAKSAGTIMAMAADDIVMRESSALGPIDAQLSWQGKRFSAGALLEGFEKIKAEVIATQVLNKAYIPILQNISPGEIESAKNSLNFSTTLVTRWLKQYKFKNWSKHSSTGDDVSDEDKEQRASQIADQLCDHKRWLTHGRSIKMEDLRAMRLKITDWRDSPVLADAIVRYKSLMSMTFATNIYKIFETPGFADLQVPCSSIAASRAGHTRRERNSDGNAVCSVPA